MKKLVVFLLLLLWPAMAARGESWVVETDYNSTFHVGSFAEVAPELVQSALLDTTFAVDESIGGVLITDENSETKAVSRRMLFLAVKHREEILLVAGNEIPDEGWEIRVASDRFLRKDEGFVIGARPWCSSSGDVIMV